MLRTINIIGLVCMLVLFCVFGQMANAHEFIIKPVHMNPVSGEKFPFSVLSAHVFMVSEEVEPPEQVTVQLIHGDTKIPVTLAKNDTLLTLDGAVEIPAKGTWIISGHRNGMIWTKTTQGWKQASKKGLTGVISSGKYEKFCKTLVNVETGDDGYRQIVGDALEIVPQMNPGSVRVGEEVPVQVLFNGKPLTTEVFATYDGFSKRPNTYGFYTETDENGMAHIGIDHPGLWMVRVQHKLDTPTEDYDTHVLRAIVMFEIQ